MLAPDTQYLPPPPPPPPSKRHRARWWVLGGVLTAVSLLVALLVVPAARDSSKYRDAHAAYQRGDCTAAVNLFDSFIGAWRLVDAGGHVGDAKAERAECQSLIDLDARAAAEPSTALPAYLAWLDAHASSPLAAVVPKHATALGARTTPASLAGLETCGILPTLVERRLLDDASMPAMRGACLPVLVAGGRADDAGAMAEEILADTDAPGAERAAAYVSAEADCTDAARLVDLRGLASRHGPLAELAYRCAPVAEADGRYGDAVTLYQTFLRVAPSDPRAGEANAGLARSLIAQAKEGGAGELPPPSRTGGSGSSLAGVVVFNQSPHELRVVVSGATNEIRTIPACGDCVEYSLIGPSECRTDLPSIELSLPAGRYDVLAETTDGSVRPFVGSWALDGGAEYQSCFFIVTTFGG